MRAKLLYLILGALLFSQIPVTTHVTSAMRVVVYVAYAPCPKCPPEHDPLLQYIDQLKVTLHDMGVTDVWVRYLEMDPQAGRDLDELYQSLGVPEFMHGSFIVSINERFLFINDVPFEVIVDFLINHVEKYERIVVFRDVLRGLYMIMDEQGQIKECKIEHSIEGCLEKQGVTPIPLSSVLPLIVVSGLLDGINPCAFAVLLFFTAFLLITSRFSFERTQRRVLLIGSIYITGVYLAYLMIGLGIIRIIAITPFPRLVGKIGALLVILLGTINIKDYFWYGQGFSLGISTPQWKAVRKWMRRSTVPSAFVAGLLVSVFEFPCTGGIYVAILGMLAQKTTFAQGFVYLLIYNVAFVLPLMAILVFASRKKIMKFSLEEWQRREGRRMRLLSSLMMMTLGMFLLFSGFI